MLRPDHEKVADVSSTALQTDAVTRAKLGDDAVGYAEIDRAELEGEGVAIIAIQPAITDLSLTPSETYTASELGDVADKVDEILAALRLAPVVET